MTYRFIPFGKIIDVLIRDSYQGFIRNEVDDSSDPLKHAIWT